MQQSPVVSKIFSRWSDLNLPNCWLVAGAVVQSHWNHAHGFPSDQGIKDIDIVYFDQADLSQETEWEHALRINGLYGDLGIGVDVKNEARVHLWYEGRFGYPIDAYSSVESAIATFPTTAGSIGIRPNDHGYESIAPFGFDDLINLIVRPNKIQVTPSIYAEKVCRWKKIWPLLEFIEWDDA